MKSSEIVSYIKHYMNKDMCKGAIMLTGAWGTGKSFFVKNELAPAISRDNKKCVLVSLYGMKNISEISKDIYFDLRAKKYISDSEKVVAGVLLAKTIARGITSFFGIDLKAGDSELQELYEAVDLKDKQIMK